MGLTDTFFNLGVLHRVLPLLLSGVEATILLALTAIVCGAAAGLVICLLRLYAPLPLRLLAIGFIDIFRAIPTLVVLILIYYALPFVGLRFSSFASAAIGLTIVLAAFNAEVFRAGVEAVPKGQFEASRALGLSFPVAMRRVILPQALRLVIPPMTSNCISIFKETSLASVVAMPDLLKQATDAEAMMANATPLIGAALIYLVMLWPLVRLSGYLEPRGRQLSR